MPTYDITEDVPYDLSLPSTEATFELTDIAYDVVIDDLPFIVNVSNQNPYRRETAPYKKDQFDNSPEPGEQSLSGWWLRSQTSWHNGAGISFYEPGSDYEHVTHRFADSRGIDIWTIGQATLLNDVYHSYTGANGIVSTAAGTDGDDYIITGDSRGYLKRITLNGDTTDAGDVDSYTLDAQHLSASTGTVNPFKSITSDGTRYFAVCDKAIHTGEIDNLTSDISMYRHNTAGVHVIKFTKGYLMFGEARVLTYLPITLTDIVHDTGGSTIPAGGKTHQSADFAWNVIEGGDKVIYAAGYSGRDSEIWAVPFDDTTLLPDAASAIQVAQLPFGEIVKSMCFYLGYLAIGTNKGIRIAQTNSADGSIVLGPLLVETNYDVTGFVTNDRYIWASTSVKDGALVSACLVRVDLSAQFNDGSFAYAYDLQYLSNENSYGKNVHYADDRLHIVLDEGATAGEIQTENLSRKRSSGWIETGKIRYGTIEPKFFRYINVQCTTGQGDNITVYTIDKNGQELSLAVISEGLSNQDVFMTTLPTKQEFVSFKFVFNNATDDQELPVLEAYQIKAVPAIRRQRIYQYPLSCYDSEMDRFSSIFGYEGRAIEFIQRIESIEETGKFVGVTDYRTGEQYQGIIEEVRFTNESSPDKNNSGFGGLLLVTVRKM